MEKKLKKKINLYNVDPLKKSEMKLFKGGAYFYCTITFHGGNVMSGYCGSSSSESNCCDDIYRIHGPYQCCSCT